MSKRVRQAKFFLKRSPLQKQRWLVFILLALVGAIAAVSLHTTIASPSSNRQVGSVVRAGGLGLYSREFHSPGLNLTAKQSESKSNSPSPQYLAPKLSDAIQQGKELYQAGQFSEAVTAWQRAATTFEAQGDVLNQALTLSFLASAFEQLGQWTEATKAITQSLQLLANNKQQTSDRQLILAQVLNTQGNLQLTQGQESDAVETWQQAEAAYQKAGDEVGILGSQINQARALQALGLYKRATMILEEVEKTLQKQPDSALKVAGLRNLGNTLRLVGDLDRTRIVLQQSLAIAERLREESRLSLDEDESASDISGILMSLGNTVRAQGETDTALKFYRQAAETAPLPTTKIQAQVIQLNLLIEAKRSAEAQTLWTQIQPQLAELPPSRLAVYTQIDFAQSLMKIGREGGGGVTEPILASARLLANALQQARSLNDARAESYALGSLGTLYEQTRQWDNAQELTRQALILAQIINAPDIAYQWQWHLGRLLKAQGDINNSKPDAIGSSHTHKAGVNEAMRASAIAAYTEAVNTLSYLRKDLVSINTDVQFSFRESVEPVYRELVELLLQSPQGGEPSQQNLKQAREVIESLQLAELDNFFQEACLTAKPVQVDQINPQTAIIYPIILPNRLAVILSFPKQPLSYYETSLPQSEVERILDQMQQSLRPTSFTQERLPIAKQVYDLLLRSAEDKLAASGVTTLVFVLDSSLRNLPMAALYDGQKYLIEKYNIALAPGLQLLQPQPLERQQLKGLVGGLSEARQGFSALPSVAIEVNQIESEIPSQVLLDQTFTSTTLQSQLNSAPFPVIHLATHGRFSSRAEDTFILTWDDRINVKQLDTLLRSREQGELNPIELLVLSACQTATGDRRAALGLAGLAVRSGARSTLATLWSVNDRSTAFFMVEFYQGLGQPGVTKSQAVRTAQLELLKQPQYEHPYYWAPFILLGNWL
ncbi:CHAT domain-containing protein [Coleofasciculus sp. FACHB-129]|uniref:CHAT domain-containing protein n=1 Tax=Cyanophyceae TaxID=3028117 RepID=UPI0016895EE9|nr:CHAT domain-containing protein [Coleofasciculus sp. FACHB-129]MBD1895856.1 CHAT domain-containing protein [Coleofasciculus sp. FACHB-129]